MGTFDRALQGLVVQRRRTLSEIGSEATWIIDTGALRPGGRVLSAGAGHDISFEEALVRDFGQEVVLLDPSPTGVATVARSRERVDFRPVGLGDRDETVRFAAPRAGDRTGSFRPVEADAAAVVEFRCVALETLVRELGWRTAAVLKIDIEGMEYRVLRQLRRRLGAVFDQVCVEFHHRLPGMNPWRQRCRTAWALAAMRAAGYVVAHKRGGDFTFVRRRRA